LRLGAGLPTPPTRATEGLFCPLRLIILILRSDSFPNSELGRAGETKSVALAGTFTDWKERPLAITGPNARGAYSTTVVLGPGSHEYKFLIDGEAFREDPDNHESAGFFHNSLIRLP
jgi:Glycogen recognition site of AMP-activated protein kinase